MQHLQRHHNFTKKYNAFKEYEELSTLKRTRMENRKRKNDSSEEERPKKQQKIADCVTSKFNRDDPRQVRINNSLASMICTDGIPTNVVNRDGFKNLMNTVEPRYTIPHYNTFSRSIIPKLKDAVSSFQKQKINKALDNETSMGFSLDGLDCKDVERSAVWSFTLYFYDDDNLCSETVKTEALVPPINAIAVKDFVTTCLKNFNILGRDNHPKVALWGCSDEGSNIKRALKLLEQEKIIAGYFFCFNHQIQNIIKDAIRTTPGMEKSLDVFRQYASNLSRSKNERHSFKTACVTAGVPVIVPPVPGVTRWFADLIMAEACLKSEDGIKLHCVKSGKNISTVDWKNLRGYVDILKPFHAATKIEQGDLYVTLSSVIPVTSILHEKTLAYIRNRNHNGFGIGFAKNVLASLEDKFGVYPKFMLMKPHCLATITDPRFSWLYFSKKPEIENVQHDVLVYVREEMEDIAFETSEQNPSEQNPSANEEPDSFWAAFDRREERPSECSADPIEKELNQWKGISALSRVSNPVHAMAGLKREFPAINKLFRKYSVFPATQNADERLFSMVGRMTGPQCRRIKATTIDKKVVVGAAIHKHGFIFKYTDGNDTSTSD